MKRFTILAVGAGLAAMLTSGYIFDPAIAAATPPPAQASAPVAPPASDTIADLTNQSQSNIAMAQMLFKLGQLQGQVAGIRQQAVDVARLTEQLKTAQDQLKTCQAGQHPATSTQRGPQSPAKK